METADLPISFLSWLLALAPILVLLVLLAVLRWKAPQAGPIGMFAAAAVSLLALRMPWETLAVAGAKGIWDAIYILYVVWPALLLYLVTDRAGGYDALRQGVTRFSRNELFIVVALGWVFSSFLQGIAGFGTPIAIVAPILVALRVRPVYAVAIPLIGHAWAKFFGTLGVSWVATLQVTDVEDPELTAVLTSVLLFIPIVVPLSLAGSDVACVTEAPKQYLNDIRPSCPQRGSLELARRKSSDTLMLASSHEGSTRPRHRATAL